ANGAVKMQPQVAVSGVAEPEQHARQAEHQAEEERAQEQRRKPVHGKLRHAIGRSGLHASYSRVICTSTDDPLTSVKRLWRETGHRALRLLDCDAPRPRGTAHISRVLPQENGP